MSSQTVELKVGMSCQGCVGAVKRVLGKLEEAKGDLTVKGNVQPEVVLQTVSKTGKATSFWEAPAPTAPATEKAVAAAPAAEAATATAPTSEAPAAEPESKPTETIAAA